MWLLDFPVIYYKFDVTSRCKTFGVDVSGHPFEAMKRLFWHFNDNRFLTAREDYHWLLGELRKRLDPSMNCKSRVKKPLFGYLSFDAKRLGCWPKEMTAKLNSFGGLVTLKRYTSGNHQDNVNSLNENEPTFLEVIVGTCRVKLTINPEGQTVSLNLQPGMGILVLPAQFHHIIPLSETCFKFTTTFCGDGQLNSFGTYRNGTAVPKGEPVEMPYHGWRHESRCCSKQVGRPAKRQKKKNAGGNYSKMEKRARRHAVTTKSAESKEPRGPKAVMYLNMLRDQELAEDSRRLQKPSAKSTKMKKVLATRKRHRCARKSFTKALKNIVSNE